MLPQLQTNIFNYNSFVCPVRKEIYKSYRCPKFDGDAQQTLEIRVERKRNNRSKNRVLDLNFDEETKSRWKLWSLHSNKQC